MIPLRPLTLGDIFSGAIATIKGNPTATIGLSMILALIVSIPTAILLFFLNDTSTPNEAVAGGVSMVVRFFSQIASALSSIVLSGMLVAVLSEAVLGHRMSIGEAWQRVRRHILALIAIPLLEGLAMVLAIVLVVVLIWAVSTAAPVGATIGVGLLLGLGALVLLLLCYVRLILAAPAVVLERCGPITAFKRSWALAEGQFWRILGITLLTGVVVAVVSGILSSVVVIPVTLALVMSNPGLLIAITTIVSLLISGLTSPFQAHVIGLLYIDERIRKEGLDVSLMAAATPQKNVAF